MAAGYALDRDRLGEVVGVGRREAHRLGHDWVGTEHLLLAVLIERHSRAAQVLQKLSGDSRKIQEKIEIAIPPSTTSHASSIPLTTQAERVLPISGDEARRYQSGSVDSEHLLLAFLRDEDNLAARTLEQFNITYETVREELARLQESRKN